MGSGMLEEAVPWTVQSSGISLRLALVLQPFFLYWENKPLQWYIFWVWEEIQFTSNRGAREKAKLGSKLEESLGPGRSKKSFEKGLWIRLSEWDLDTEEAARDYQRRTGGKRNRKKANSKDLWRIHLTKRNFLLNSYDTRNWCLPPSYNRRCLHCSKWACFPFKQWKVWG